MQNKILRQIFRGTPDSGPATEIGPLELLASGSAKESTDYTAAGSLLSQALPGLARESQEAKQGSTVETADSTGLRLAENPLVTPALGKPDISQVLQPSQADLLSDASGRSADILSEVSKNLEKLRAATEAQSAILGTNTEALVSNTASKAVSQVLSTASKTASGLLGGLTSLPFISGIAKLFGGGEAAAAPVLPKYSSPEAVHFESAIRNDAAGQSIEAAAYDRYGNTRLPITPEAAVPSYSTLLSEASALGSVPKQTQASDTPSLDGWNDGQLNRSPPAPSAQVTVNIQAMDSRSFLDRSQDIAQAVREAMLNMHSINDVVNDL